VPSDEPPAAPPPARPGVGWLVLALLLAPFNTYRAVRWWEREPRVEARSAADVAEGVFYHAMAVVACALVALWVRDRMRRPR
jgi:hypothetical protein